MHYSWTIIIIITIILKFIWVIVLKQCHHSCHIFECELS